MKNCIMLWKNDAVDLSINNQRRAFSDAYNNEVLAESKIYIELSSKNPLSKLSSLETEDLKNNPCILVINQTGQQATACLFLTSNKTTAARMIYTRIDTIQYIELVVDT